MITAVSGPPATLRDGIHGIRQGYATNMVETALKGMVREGGIYSERAVELISHITQKSGWPMENAEKNSPEYRKNINLLSEAAQLAEKAMGSKEALSDG